MRTDVDVASPSALIDADRRPVNRSTIAAMAGSSLIALGGLTGLAACTASSGPAAAPVSPAAPTSSRPTVSSSSPSSAPAPDPSALATTQVLAFFPTYVRLLDRLANSATLPLADIYTVSVDPDATNQLHDAGTFRGAGDRGSGYSTVTQARVTSVELANQPTATPPKRPTVMLAACVDTSQVRAVDPGGHSVIPADATRYLIDTVTVVNINYPAASGWRVENLTNTQANSCAA